MAERLKIKDVMKAYLASSGMTHEKFANALTDSLVNTNVSRVAVTNWKNGKSEPNTDFLLVCMVAYSDWRSTWAVDCLKMKLPEIFESGMVTFHLPRAE